MKRYDSAKELFEKYGINTENALEELDKIAISMHCWQGDDVAGFENSGDLSGGIQTTGNYPGAARNPIELMADIEKALSMVPGKHRLNLHASYAIFEDEIVDRNKLEPKHFEKWVEFAKKNDLGLDFNPTYFSHPYSVNATLSSENESIRRFWVEHGQASIRICEYFARELGSSTLMNIWIPDGYKDTPAARLAPRARLKRSLDEIISIDYDKSLVKIALESKVFGIGVESYTVGSHEFYMNYASQHNLLCLLDNGHYHPTEKVSDKISSMLLFFDQVALHVTRPVRWDSDHVVILDDELKEIAKEIIVNGAEKTIIGLDFFDASINRIAAWVIGMRNMQKALLIALLTPHKTLLELQNERRLTEVLMLQEEIKTLPFGDVWEEYLNRNNIKSNDWYNDVKEYEKSVLMKRGS